MTRAPLHPEEAVEIVLAEVEPRPAEAVPLEAALGRVTAGAVVSRQAVPGFDNSAMDGFAVRSADPTDAVDPRRIVGESRAGHPSEVGPGAGEAVRISTGAMMPAGADAVVPVEHTDEDERGVRLRQPPVPGANVRRIGEDVEPGDRVLERGVRIGAAELGVLASVGLASVECARRPTVAVLTGGDELMVPGSPLGPGEIYDVSRFSLPALAGLAGAEVERVETLRDDPDTTRAAIGRALGCDAVVICGGVSVGAHDHVRGALSALDVEERFWRVSLRPGKPTWFGVSAAAGSDRTLVFGLPGNPVSAMVTFHIFVRPALRAMLRLDPNPPSATAVLEEPYVSTPGRVEYLRCRVEPGEDGLRIRPSRASQGSHVLTSMLGADALAIIPSELEELKPGRRLRVEFLEGRDPDWLRG